jgi:Arc/MetJ family transcription regulator
MMHYYIKIESSFSLFRSHAMRTTITIDDALCQKAPELADPQMDKADLFRVVVSTFVRVQAAKRLAALGGTAPYMADVPRRHGVSQLNECAGGHRSLGGAFSPSEYRFSAFD